MFWAKSCFCFRAELLRPQNSQLLVFNIGVVSIQPSSWKNWEAPQVQRRQIATSNKGSPQNPYQGPEAGGVLPPNHFIHKAKRVIYIILSGYGLHIHFKFFKTLLKSPNIRHEWFQLIGHYCWYVTDTLRVYPTASLRLSSLTNEVYDIGPLYLLTQVFSELPTTYSPAILMIKAYIETYEGKVLKKAINY